MSKKSRPWTRQQRTRIRARTEDGSRRAAWGLGFFGIDRATTTNQLVGWAYDTSGKSILEAIEEAVKLIASMPQPVPCGFDESHPHAVPPGRPPGARVQCGNCGRSLFVVDEGHAIDAAPAWMTDWMAPQRVP